MPHHLEVRILDQMRDVRPPAGIEIIDTEDVVTIVDQTFAKVRTKEACAARNHVAFN